MDRCLLTSSEATTRVGRAVNRYYKRVTTKLNLDTTRFVTISTTTTNGQATVTFAEIEQIDRILDTTDSDNIRLLQETSIHEIRSNQPRTGEPLQWAVQATDADAVQVRLDTLPQTSYSLQADGKTTLATLSGSQEPVIPESYHDILTWYCIAEELLKKGKVQDAREYERRADALVMELQHQLADSATHATRQGGGTSGALSGGSGGSGGSVGGTAYTQSALLSFEQDTLRLLDSDESHGVTINISSDLTAERTLDIATGDANRVITLSGDPTLADWFDQAVKAASSPTFAGLTVTNGFANTGLTIQDTDASHALTLAPGSNLTANRTLTLTTGDADRTLTIAGNASVNQDTQTTASPTFAGVTLANTGLHLLDTDASHDLIVKPGSNLTADRTLTVTTGDSDRTVTLSGNPTLSDWFDQSVKQAASPAFASVTLSAGAGSETYVPSGLIHFDDTNDATSGTSEETLATYTLPANTLNATGRGLRITAWFLTASNGNNKRARIRFGGTAGTSMADTGTITANAGRIVCEVEVYRTGAATEDFWGTAIYDSGVQVEAGTDAVDLTSTVDIVVRGETTGASGDLTFLGWAIRFI